MNIEMLRKEYQALLYKMMTTKPKPYPADIGKFRKLSKQLKELESVS